MLHNLPKGKFIVSCFVNKNYVLQICSLLRGGIAERGGVRVGHRIIEINGQSVVAVPHEKIVNLLATSVGEVLLHDVLYCYMLKKIDIFNPWEINYFLSFKINMKTMPTSMFRLLTGQETPLYIWLQQVPPVPTQPFVSSSSTLILLLVSSILLHTQHICILVASLFNRERILFPLYHKDSTFNISLFCAETQLMKYGESCYRRWTIYVCRMYINSIYVYKYACKNI